MPLSSSIRTPRRAISTALASAFCVLSVAALPSGALAAEGSVVATTPAGIDILETADTAQTCRAPQIINPFAGFGDMRDYVLAPGGTFEEKQLEGWQVVKAKQDGDHSPLELSNNRKDDNKHSLKVPAGGSAVSPAMCVDLHYPTMRFMAKPEKNKGRLDIQVVYPDSGKPVFHDVRQPRVDGQGVDRHGRPARLPRAWRGGPRDAARGAPLHLGRHQRPGRRLAHRRPVRRPAPPLAHHRHDSRGARHRAGLLSSG